MVVKTTKFSGRRERALALMQELRALRTEKGWTQEDLALELRIPSVTVGRWDRGQTVPVSPTILDAVERYLQRHRLKE